MTKVIRQNKPEHKRNPRVTARTMAVVRILVVFKSNQCCSAVFCGSVPAVQNMKLDTMF